VLDFVANFTSAKDYTEDAWYYTAAIIFLRLSLERILLGRNDAYTFLWPLG